ncbi:hypothetical protein OHB35_36450 [Streptomyces phaeochromogenes]|uniref:Uncharacterized protein n=1 Tax=Streptomyces phaeochromogenes TaxID=1923 RepID=A0ABZ1HM96_STRPH|nr:hypothetical protein [Streptomyces phaeochromogenes]WSD18274.1 hypothetical protein OHB35_36450 [Streptomyces phaeochromogenes]
MVDQVVIWLLLAVAGAAVQRISDVVFGESIEKLVYSLLVRRRTAEVSVAGQWHSAFEWISDDDGRARVDRQTLRASQRGRRVIMKDPGGPDRSRLRLQGTVTAGGVFSGEWEEWTLSGRHYRGVFQFLLARTGSEMRGQWVGFNRYDTVQNGSWVLNRA